MTPEEAVKMADELSLTGKWRDKWGYYPAYHARHEKWFVCRRLKNAEIHVAVFTTGERSIFE